MSDTSFNQPALPAESNEPLPPEIEAERLRSSRVGWIAALGADVAGGVLACAVGVDPDRVIVAASGIGLFIGGEIGAINRRLGRLSAVQDAAETTPDQE